jgi:hypothetical protein
MKFRALNLVDKNKKLVNEKLGILRRSIDSHFILQADILNKTHAKEQRSSVPVAAML